VCIALAQPNTWAVIGFHRWHTSSHCYPHDNWCISRYFSLTFGPLRLDRARTFSKVMALEREGAMTDHKLGSGYHPGCLSAKSHSVTGRTDRAEHLRKHIVNESAGPSTYKSRVRSYKAGTHLVFPSGFLIILRTIFVFLHIECLLGLRHPCLACGYSGC
jgi:hypothetical protein